MMKLYALVVAAAVVGLVGEGRAADQVQPKTVITPQPMQETVAAIGSPVFVTSAYYPMPGAVIAAGEIRMGKKTFPNDYPLTTVPSTKGVKACIVAEGYVTTRCLLDEDRDGKFERADSKMIDVPVPYEERELPDPRHASVQNIYLYSGATSDSLRLTYREVTNERYQPRLDQEFTIPLSKSFPQQIAIKTLKMTILSIDGMGMRYRIEQ
ncbi:hypothetical protein [Rhizorhabdus histidinilytica]|uniref:hypothetical protein n=1 Tax=Rhizorhabdus histidinilytica TaxID=439228 RepID=UPI00321FA98E